MMLKKLLAMGLISASVAFTGCQSIADGVSNIEKANLEQLQNRTWIVTHIGNNAISTSPTARNIPSLQLDSASNRVSGADGCNRIMGGFKAGRDTLSFSQMAGTQMACLNTGNVPQQFTSALSQVTNYHIEGKILKLLDNQGNVLVQLVNAIQPR